MRNSGTVALAGLLTLAACLPNGGQMRVENQGVAADGIDFLSVEHSTEYVIGLPVWVAVTVRARPDTAFHQLAFGDLVNLRSCIGLEMTGASFTRNEMPTPVVEEELGRKPQSLMPGETRRMLVDISPLVGPSVPEGDYRIRLTYVSPDFSLAGKPFAVRFRQPNPSERGLLASSESRQRFPNWASWMYACEGQSLPLSRIPADSPAALTFVLNNLFCGVEPLSSIQPERLDAFAEIPGAERKALQAELLLARGDTARFGQLRDAILRDTPGLAWWLTKVERGAGFLKTFSKRPH